MKTHTIQYTIRGVSTEVDRVLRERAARQNTSINQIVLDELTRGTIGRSKKADFSDLVGVWEPDKAFDEIMEAQRTVSQDDWN